MPVRIGGRALDILTALVERPGELVSKRELISRVWPDTVVEEGNLKVNMAALRRALGEGPGAAQYIATVIGRGYRFVAPVRPASAARAALDGARRRAATTCRPGRRASSAGRMRSTPSDATWMSRGSCRSSAPAASERRRWRSPSPSRRSGAQDGVWLVDLALLKRSGSGAQRHATAIGLAVHSADCCRVCEFLRDRKILLVLDNCEHVIDAAGLLRGSTCLPNRGVKILATSREPLRVKGERVRRLPGWARRPSFRA